MKRGQGKPQEEEKGKKQKSQVEEAGEGAKEGVVGKSAVAENPGIGPPKETKGTPAPGGPAVDEVQIRGKEEASQKVSQSQGKKFPFKPQGISPAQN